MQLIVAVGLATISGIITATLIGATNNASAGSALERLIRSDAAARSAFIRLEVAIEDPSDQFEQTVLSNNPRAGFTLGPEANVRLEPIGGKIDVLDVAPEVSDRYLAAAGLSPDESAKALATIDADRQNGDGTAALDHLAEALPGLSHLETDLTRFGSALIDPSLATAGVLAAIPDLGATQVAELVRTAPGERARLQIPSQYFAAAPSTRFDVVAHLNWSVGVASEWRLPIEISAAGQLIPLAGPSL